jgi:hypothetical protein
MYVMEYDVTDSDRDINNSYEMRSGVGNFGFSFGMIMRSAKTYGTKIGLRCEYLFFYRH